uniref:Uncharacterized protein n=1 Tax=Anguilla anguilla TaxID=7936 RepID=A0A0E9QWX2_ANGAN
MLNWVTYFLISIVSIVSAVVHGIASLVMQCCLINVYLSVPFCVFVVSITQICVG